ncbi:uncharacterized aarF domain-containing protein kinase 2 [Protobothrops mucrosquamatus]|uniref:uncharacterized aarF domain-containing protein kinase 2 n=1 Tax=Protobothrops mucrosquamatus TaxID=103944 RepID=UPI00077563B3|nr:uncharacterized aarF domain-containing protein kinase 2 [Protobothrops mucrosquamatus]
MTRLYGAIQPADSVSPITRTHGAVFNLEYSPGGIGLRPLWLKASLSTGSTNLLGAYAASKALAYVFEAIPVLSFGALSPVLHPGLVQQVQMDLFLMKIGSRFLELFPGIRWLSVTEIVEEFEKLMIQQVDLRYEAKNLEHFHLNFQGTDYVRFPLPLHPFVTKNILVETFEESKPISQYLHIDTKMELRQKIAKMGMDMLLKMVFVDNFVHADLHPGNILVQGAEQFGDHPEDGAVIVDLLDTLIVELQPSSSPLRLVLLDAGIVAELQSGDLENFRAVFTAIVLGQGEKVAELILHHSRANQCKDVEKFKADMAELVTRARSNAVALEKFQVASLLSSVFRLLMIHQVKLESNFACVVFAIMVLEGLGRSLDPDLDVLKAAKPLLINPPN